MNKKDYTQNVVNVACDSILEDIFVDDITLFG